MVAGCLFCSTRIRSGVGVSSTHLWDFAKQCINGRCSLSFVQSTGHDKSVKALVVSGRLSVLLSKFLYPTSLNFLWACRLFEGYLHETALNNITRSACWWQQSKPQFHSCPLPALTNVKLLGQAWTPERHDLGRISTLPPNRKRWFGCICINCKQIIYNHRWFICEHVFLFSITFPVRSYSC